MAIEMVVTVVLVQLLLHSAAGSQLPSARHAHALVTASPAFAGTALAFLAAAGLGRVRCALPALAADQVIAALASQALVELVHVGAVAVRVFGLVVGLHGLLLEGVAAGVNVTGIHVGGNAALVCVNVKESLVAPSSAPAVLDDPVHTAVFSAPTHDLDCVAAGASLRGLLLDAAVLAEEVLVHGEAGLHGTLAHDSLLDFADFVPILHGGNLHAVLPRAAVAAAAVRALPVVDGGVLAGALERVAQAGIIHYSRVLEVIPAPLERSTVASMVVSVAQHHVFGR